MEDSRSQRRVGGIVCFGFMRGGTHRQEEQEEEDMQTGVRGAEITYSRHPGWLWQSEWAPGPPGRVWPPSTGFSCSGQRDLETTPRLWRLRSCKQRQGWVRGEVTQRSLTRSERTLVEVVCSCGAHRGPFITKSQDRKPRECPKQTTKPQQVVLAESTVLLQASNTWFVESRVKWLVVWLADQSPSMD